MEHQFLCSAMGMPHSTQTRTRGLGGSFRPSNRFSNDTLYLPAATIPYTFDDAHWFKVGPTRRRPMNTGRTRTWGAAFLLVVVGVVLGHAQSPAKLPSDLDPDSRARLPYLQKKDMDERGQKIFDALPGRGQDGVLRGPLAFAAYNPAVAQALFDLHNAAVAGTLDPHVRELAILVACRETNY